MRRSLNPATAKRSRLPLNDDEELELDRERIRDLERELSAASPQQRRAQPFELEDEPQRKHMDLLRSRQKIAHAQVPLAASSSLSAQSSLGSLGLGRVRSAPSLSKDPLASSNISAGKSALSNKTAARSGWGGLEDVQELAGSHHVTHKERPADSKHKKIMTSSATSLAAAALIAPHGRASMSNDVDLGTPATSPTLAQKLGTRRSIPTFAESDLPSTVDRGIVTRSPQPARSRSSPVGHTMASAPIGSKCLGRSAAHSYTSPSHRLRTDPHLAKPEQSDGNTFHFMPPGLSDAEHHRSEIDRLNADGGHPRSEIDRLNARLEGMQATMKADMKAINAQGLIDFLKKHDLMALHEALVKNGIDGVHRLIIMDSQQLSSLLSRCNADGMDEITLLSAVRDMQSFPI